MIYPRIVAIIRGVQPQYALPVVEALLEEGISWVEISLSDEKDGFASLQKVNKYFGNELKLGVGTVINEKQVDKAIEYGAQYIITPGWDRNLVRYIHKQRKPVISGVLTPGEIMQAAREGVEIFKIFPAGSFGPGYIKNLLGPFPNLHFMAVGGINEGNVLDFMKAGCSSAAIGSDLVPRGAVLEDIERIRSRAKIYQNLLT